MSLLDIMVAKGYIGTRQNSDGQGTANETVALERGKKKATWRKAWAVHIDFSNVIPEVGGTGPIHEFRRHKQLLIPYSFLDRGSIVHDKRLPD